MATSYYRVSPKIWREKWSDDTRMAAFYVLTCEHRTTEGLFRLPEAYVLADLGWRPKRVREAFSELVSDDVIRRHDDVVLIVKALKTQAPQNPNQMVHAIRALEVVPATPLDTDFIGLAQRFAQRFAERLAQALPERFGEPPALAPSPALAPPPTPGEAENGASAEKTRALAEYLVGEGWHSDDISLAMKRLATRQRFGEPIKDPVAWLTPMLQSMTQARGAAGPGTAGIVELDGVPHELVDGQWREVVTS